MESLFVIAIIVQVQFQWRLTKYDYGLINSQPDKKIGIKFTCYKCRFILKELTDYSDEERSVRKIVPATNRFKTSHRSIIVI